ncbi:MAG TPA: transcriptional regulator [Hyphomonas sp.]|nr:transcriptional regulator [Hyphomonas sp.]
MDAKQRVARNLQTLRCESGLTQEELAHRSKIHQTYLSGLEGGKRNPSVEVLERLCRALKADISDLFRKS